MWASFKIFFALEYNELPEEHIFNTTQPGFQHASHAAEEQRYLFEHWTTWHLYLSQERMSLPI